ncbi:MAG: glucuronate isomerase [Oscillospiraceae bacterium]|jgi:glucuronate isomerase|nr:glucuronate isomerase [Oscillospiraceae bacterium]
MATFLDDDFLLENEAARRMFQAANAMPIFDWHCHLSPKEIYENTPPVDLARLWLGGDHYKWRAMRFCGVREDCITGGVPGKEKFFALAGCLPKLIGNPLYHWCHLELRRYFGIQETLGPQTAEQVWQKSLRAIQNGGFTPQELIQTSGVVALCTTDDPAERLDYHKALQMQALPFRVLPAFRPDKALAIEQEGFLPWLEQLAALCGHSIGSFEALTHSLLERMDAFDALGCRASDHGYGYIPFAPAPAEAIEAGFRARLRGEALRCDQAEQYRYALLQALAAGYAKRGWVMELHIGALRNNSAAMLRRLGPDCGCDSIDDAPLARPLSRFLNALEERGTLPKTILFNLNPKDSAVLVALLGNFQGGEPAGKLQYGPAWWFLDHIDGMRTHLRTLGNLGALGVFIGMATDSRSFLSYPRHEYFRRIFCGFCGDLVERGLYPYDAAALEQLARDVALRNAAHYFGL